jgi:hypothetical protein
MDEKTKSSFNYTFMYTLNKNKKTKQNTLLQMINDAHETNMKAL